MAQSGATGRHVGYPSGLQAFAVGVTEMTSVKVDSETLERLRGVTECVQLCDESGCVVGYFRPAGGLQRYPEPPSLDPQQLQQQLAAPNRRTISEILADLASRV